MNTAKDIESIENLVSQEVEIDSLLFNKAKHFLLDYKNFIEEFIVDVPAAIKEFLSQNNIETPVKFIFYDDGKLYKSQTDAIIDYYEHTVALCEAVLSLINSTVFMKFDALFPITHSLPYSSQMNQMGIDGYFNFKKFKMQIPMRIKRTLSSDKSNFIFTDPELFISETNIKNAHAEVIEALKDSIECFKNELYRPAITMLGKAVEGAWIELGISIFKYVEDKKQDTKKIMERLMGREDFVWKLDQTIKLYNRQEWFEVIVNKSGIKTNHLTEIFHWTEIVRDARNAIHFGAEPTLPNNFDKTSVLLMLAVKHLRTLYKLKNVTDIELNFRETNSEDNRLSNNLISDTTI